MNHYVLQYLRLMLSCCLLALPGYAIAATPAKVTQNVTVAHDVEIPLTQFPGTSKGVLLWLPSERGLTPTQFKIAAKLAKSGVEVWMADLHAGYFLPTLPSSLQKIPTDDMLQLITAVQQRSHKPVYLITEDKGAALALTAAAALKGKQQDIRGAILLSPNFHVTTPEPGEDAQFLPITTHSSLPVYILQPELSAFRWRIDQLQALLEQGGTKVKVQLLPRVRDRYYLLEDHSPVEQSLAANLPQHILRAYHHLEELHP